jgi:arylsulfatase A-like enzyme
LEWAVHGLKNDTHDELPPGAAFRLGAAVVGGWVLHDLCVYLVSGEPRLAAQIAPISLAAVVLGGLAGLVLARSPRLLVGAVVLCAGLSLAPSLGLHIVPGNRWLPRAALLLVVGLAAARASTGKPWGGLRAAWLAGVAGCVLVALYQRQAAVVSWSLLLAVAAATAAGALRAPRWATLLCALVPAAWVALEARSGVQLRRPDLPAREARAGSRAANLVLIVLDTVRADRLAPYGYGRLTTPGLDAFARERCRRYSDARSTSSWTLPSHASLFTGLLPDEHGATRPRGESGAETVTLQAWPGQGLRTDVPTLAEILRETGYQTAAILGNISFLRHEFGLDRGFERYDDRRSAWIPDYLALVQLAGFHPRVGFLPYREGRTVTDLALRWLDRRRTDAPFFLMLNYMEAHSPYIPAAPFDRAFGAERPRDPRSPEPELLQLLYDRELTSLDAQVTRLLDSIEQRGLLEDSVVIVTSDHGEAFGEHGYWLHGWNLYEETLRVPLYVKPRGPGAPGVTDEPTSGADVFRIALRELGMREDLSPPAAAMPGASHVIGQVYLTPFLLKHWRDERGLDVDPEQIAWLEGEVKFLVGVDGRVQAFDLESDPGEERALELSDEQRADALERARAWWDQHPALESSGPMTLDPSELERLKGLGYVGGE